MFPIFPFGIKFLILSFLSFGSFFHNGELKKPKTRILHLTLKTEYSITIDFIKLSNPSFEDEYNKVPASTFNPREELIKTISKILFL